MKNNTEFDDEVKANIVSLGKNDKIKDLSLKWLTESLGNRYTYNFSSLGRPIIQYPQDMIAMQELIWKIKPDLIIETGIAHGGSLVMSASMLVLLDYCEAVRNGLPLNPKESKRRVLGIDIDIREHNKIAIETHPLAHHIEMIEGSSIHEDTIQQVHAYAKRFQNVLVCLDSNHTHQHVLEELRAYAPLTSKHSYCVVFDTVIEDLPVGLYPDRAWDVGDNPKTAVHAYLKELADNRESFSAQTLAFEIDKSIDYKLQISVAPDGYLKRI